MANNVLTTTLMTISNTAIVIPAARADNRVCLVIQNLHAATPLFIGSSTVTTANGLQVAANGGIIMLDEQAQDAAIFGICASSNADIRVLEISAAAREF
jgi:hypothetical protein